MAWSLTCVGLEQSVQSVLFSGADTRDRFLWGRGERRRFPGVLRTDDTSIFNQETGRGRGGGTYAALQLDLMVVRGGGLSALIGSDDSLAPAQHLTHRKRFSGGNGGCLSACFPPQSYGGASA